MKNQHEQNDRLPPYAAEAEDAALGCVLLDPAAMGRCVERKVAADWFYQAGCQAVWNALRHMSEAGTGIDLITLQGELRARGVLEEAGGLGRLLAMQDAAPSAVNLDNYLDTLRDKMRLRKMLAVCAEGMRLAYEGTASADATLLEVESRMSALTEEEAPTRELTLREVMRAVVTDMEDWHYRRGSQQLRGLPTGTPGNYLDKVLTGIRETHFVTLASRPGGGKTAMALNIVEYLAEHHVWYEQVGQESEGNPPQKRTGMAVGVFSIEMDAESLGYRMMMGRAGVSEAKWNQGFAETGDGERLVASATQLAKLNVHIDDTPDQSIEAIAAKARRWAKTHGIKLFVLDYLQLARSNDARDDARTRVSKISKKIMALKKQLKVPWLVLAQLNRNIETAERDRNPVLSDLAESGSIEQDSDTVIILKNTPLREVEKERPSPDGTTVSDADILERICGEWEWSRRPRRVDAWVVKNRRGPTGKAEMVFTGNLCRFEDWHLWKLRQGAEERKEGESKHLTDPPVQGDLPVEAAN